MTLGGTVQFAGRKFTRARKNLILRIYSCYLLLIHYRFFMQTLCVRSSTAGVTFCLRISRTVTQVEKDCIAVNFCFSYGVKYVFALQHAVRTCDLGPLTSASGSMAVCHTSGPSGVIILY